MRTTNTSIWIDDFTGFINLVQFGISSHFELIGHSGSAQAEPEFPAKFDFS